MHCMKVKIILDVTSWSISLDKLTGNCCLNGDLKLTRTRVTTNSMNKLKREWNICMQVSCANPLTYVTVLFS